MMRRDKEKLDELLSMGPQALAELIKRGPGYDSEKANYLSPNVKQYEKEALERARRDFVFNAKSRLLPANRDNIRGMDRVLEEVDRYIFFLQNYLALREVDARTSPGLLLMGGPGIGKTLTARYIATASGARCIEVNEFPREEASWKAQDIQSLFGLARSYVAKKKKPIILFWDEFEIVAKERGEISSAEAATVSALTTELDGFAGKSQGVIFIATTNYSGTIDKALFRPGRLGHKIAYYPPTFRGKKEILKFYVEKKPHERAMDYESVAFFFSKEDSPAKIEETVEEAYLKACMRNLKNPKKAKLITKDLVDSLLENILGTPREIYLSEEKRFEIAIHETGHAVGGRLLGLPVQIVTVMPYGYDEGKTITLSDEQDSTLDFQKKGIVQLYCGLAAEDLFGIDTGGGAADIENASLTAHTLIANFGIGTRTKRINYGTFSKGGIMNLGREGYMNSASDQLRRNSESDARELLEKAHAQAHRILKRFGKKRMSYVAEQIIRNNFVVQKDLDRIIQEAMELA